MPEQNTAERLTYDTVQPDSRIECHSRGGAKGTVLAKYRAGFGGDRPVVRIDFDGFGEAYNYPEQLSALDEPAPEPTLGRPFEGVSTFFLGGDEYAVENTTGLGDVAGMWQCVRRPTDGGHRTSADYVVRNASSRAAAFELALAALRRKSA